MFPASLRYSTKMPSTPDGSPRRPLRCIAISRDDFDRLLDEEPQIARSLLRVLARRLATATNH